MDGSAPHGAQAIPIAEKSLDLRLTFGEFSHSHGVSPDMLHPKVSRKTPQKHKSIEPVRRSEIGELTADRLFAADLSGTRVLRRDEEEALANEIRAVRDRIQAHLLGASSVVSAALEPHGHRVVWPKDDFREREAVLIQQHAHALLEHTRVPRELGMTKTALRRFALTLDDDLASYRTLRDRMVRANIRLVNLLARRYQGSPMGHLDLVQEGVLGLMRAIEKYEPSRNVKFSTYATWWIWQALGRSNDMLGSLIRTPVHWGQLRRRVGRGQREFTDEQGMPLSRDEMAVAEGLDRDRFEAMTRGFSFVSTDAPARDDDERTLESLLPSDTAGPDEEVEQATLRTLLEDAMTDLPERERFILRQRFGLENDEVRSLEDLGHELGVSRERVRQLEARALTKLKQGAAGDALADYLH